MGFPFKLQAWQWAGMLLLVAVTGLLGYAFWPAPPEEAEAARPDAEAPESITEVDVVVVTPLDFPLRVEATGHLQPWRRAEVSAEAQGQVVRRPVEEGQYVRAGTLLLQLEDRDEEIEVAGAKAEWLKAKTEFDVRMRLDGLDAAADSSQAARERRAVLAANVGLTQAEQRLASAQLALDRTRILAPFSGHVADIEMEEGQRANMGQAVLTVLDDGRMKVEVDVLEADLVRLTRGGSAVVRLPALDNRAVAGTIHAINPSIDRQTGTGRVTVALPNAGGALVSGLFAYVALETDRLPDRLVVPKDAVLVRQGRDLVFRLAHGRAEWVYVTVGPRSGDHVVVEEGISPGDTIAVAGHFALAHDARARAANVANGIVLCGAGDGEC